MSFISPKTISIKECRGCGRQFYVGEKKVTLREDDEIEIVLQTFTCEECKEDGNTYYYTHTRKPR
jgi:hypothetical protein